jgi:hypothetical protein
MSKAITADTLREVMQGLLVVEDEIVTMLSGAMSDYDREQLRAEVAAELRGLANRVEGDAG